MDEIGYTFYQDNGEGSSKDNGGGSSKAPNTGKSSPINYEDYTWSSSDEDTWSDQGTSQRENNPVVVPMSELDAFKDYVQKVTTEEAAEKLNELSDKVEEYRRSGAKIPAAKAQIEMLENKIEICVMKITQDMEEAAESSDLESKGKGKEPEYIESKDKGKGKEPEK
jgi:hypothetical protein